MIDKICAIVMLMLWLAFIHNHLKNIDNKMDKVIDTIQQVVEQTKEQK